MRKLVLVTLLSACCLATQAQLSPEIKILVKDKNFFALKKRTPMLRNRAEALYCSALVNNAFGDNRQSIADVNDYLESYKPQYSDSIFLALMECQVDNFYKTGQYRLAAEGLKAILDKSTLLDADTRKDLENSWNIWNALADTPAQTVTFGSPSSVIDFTRDMAKLVNVPVTCNDTTMNAIFDTGANISVMMKSTAGRLGVKTVTDSILVKSITGKEVIAQIGVADEIQIKDITVKNPYFLIFDDADLTFGGVYKIHLIIGFPVIQQLGEVQFDLSANRITVNRDAGREEEPNLFLDGLTPIVEMKMGSTPLLLSFDSGADKTMFYPKFLEMVEKNKKYKLSPATTQLGGAGGIKKLDIFRLDEVELKVGKEKVMLQGTDVLKEALSDEKDHLYGNMGQDVLSSKGKYVINLSKMYFELKD